MDKWLHEFSPCSPNYSKHPSKMMGIQIKKQDRKTNPAQVHETVGHGRTRENLYKTEIELIIEVVILLHLEGKQWKSWQKADIS